ncbi:helix-turn-helix transcriptional regulator [Novosphingobium sp.]|uniref:helix-turn-helix domain-containing protein n=1 Tax=Novosphingobium sp. TaxID=1874826 RepID=UPI0026377D14|nr:helix-turn-helix transcriptional regulator [Novosphingobium sp.]
MDRRIDTGRGEAVVGAVAEASDAIPAPARHLTPRELEVLRLLAEGHTIKSIAAQLGWTEASINERLRDARRKTGVGSSRELARQLGAQKIWDRNPDLAMTSPAAEGSVRPALRGLSGPKGKIAMLITMPLIAAGALFMAADAPFNAARPQAAQAAAGAALASPLVGRWALDVAGVPEGERPKSVTISFAVAPDQRWTTEVQIVNLDGATLHAESTAALDAAPVPVTGNMAFIDSGSLRQPAPGTLVMTLGKDGAPVSTRVYTVSRDRKSMTETIIWAGSNMPKLETNTFRRIG